MTKAELEEMQGGLIEVGLVAAELKAENRILKKINKKLMKANRTYVAGRIKPFNSMEYIGVDFKPEPLSDYWFEALGFTKVPLSESNPEEGHYYRIRLSEDKYCDLQIMSGDKNGIVEACLFPYEDAFRFQYVHQVQNLYHAITGKELQFKPITP